MSFDRRRILAGKEAHRRMLAALPVAEKLRMLDALRVRALEIAAVREERGRRDGSQGDTHSTGLR